MNPPPPFNFNYSDMFSPLPTYFQPHNVITHSSNNSSSHTSARPSINTITADASPLISSHSSSKVLHSRPSTASAAPSSHAHIVYPTPREPPRRNSARQEEEEEKKKKKKEHTTHWEGAADFSYLLSSSSRLKKNVEKQAEKQRALMLAARRLQEKAEHEHKQHAYKTHAIQQHTNQHNNTSVFMPSHPSSHSHSHPHPHHKHAHPHAHARTMSAVEAIAAAHASVNNYNNNINNNTSSSHSISTSTSTPLPSSSSSSAYASSSSHVPMPPMPPLPSPPSSSTNASNHAAYINSYLPRPPSPPLHYSHHAPSSSHPSSSAPPRRHARSDSSYLSELDSASAAAPDIESLRLPPTWLNAHMAAIASYVQQIHHFIQQLLNQHHYDTLDEKNTQLLTIFADILQGVVRQQQHDNDTHNDNTPCTHITALITYMLKQYLVLFDHDNPTMSVMLPLLLNSLYDMSFSHMHSTPHPVPNFLRYDIMNRTHINHNYKNYEYDIMRDKHILIESFPIKNKLYWKNLCRLIFQSWRSYSKISHLKTSLFRITAVTRKKLQMKTQRTPSLLHCFYFWKNYSINSKQQRIMSSYVDALSSSLQALTSHLRHSHTDASIILKEIGNMMHKLLEIEERQLVPPIHYHAQLAPSIDMLFERWTISIEQLLAEPKGFNKLFILSPSYQTDFASPPSKSSSSTHSSSSAVQMLDPWQSSLSIIAQWSAYNTSKIWNRRHELLEEIQHAMGEEAQHEEHYMNELLHNDMEDFIVNWANFILKQMQLQQNLYHNITSPAQQTSSQAQTQSQSHHAILPSSPNNTSGHGYLHPANTTSVFSFESVTIDLTNNTKSRIKDLNTDLRDSVIYSQLISYLAPSLPLGKLRDLFDLHSKAKFILNIVNMMGMKENIMNEHEYVEGIADLHCLFLCKLFMCKNGIEHMGNEKQEVEKLKKHLVLLREQWSHIRTLSIVPPLISYSFLSHFNYFHSTFQLLSSRHARRVRFHESLHAKLNDFSWSIYRLHCTGNEEEYYNVHHINNRYYNYQDKGLIEKLLKTDTFRIKERMKNERRHMLENNNHHNIYQQLTKKQRMDLKNEEREEIENEIQNIKKLFNNYRNEIKKIQKHYTQDKKDDHFSQSTNNNNNLASFNTFSITPRAHLSPSSYTSSNTSSSKFIIQIPFLNFYSFCKDCGFLNGSEKLTKDKIEAIFYKCCGHMDFDNNNNGSSSNNNNNNSGDSHSAKDTSTDNNDSSSSPSPSASTSTLQITLPSASPFAAAPPSPASSSFSTLLTSSQFLDAIVCLSHEKYGSRIERLSDRVKICIEKDVLTGACRTVVDDFRMILSSEPVRILNKINKHKIMAIFKYYSTLNLTTGELFSPADHSVPSTPSHQSSSAPAASATSQPQTAAGDKRPPLLTIPNASASASATLNPFDINLSPTSATPQQQHHYERTFSMTFPQFLQMAKDINIYDEKKLNAKKLRGIFQNVQQDEDFGDIDLPSSPNNANNAQTNLISEILSYQEFLESLSAIACYLDPDPFITQSNKLEAFYEKYLLQTLNEKIPELKRINTKMQRKDQ